MIIHQITIQKLPVPERDGANFQGNLYTIGVSDSTKNRLWPTFLSVDVKTLMAGLAGAIEDELSKQ